MAKKKSVIDDFTAGDLARNIIGERLKLKPKNEAQKKFLNLIDEKEIIICSGPSGCGKSHISLAKALDLFQNKENKYQKILIYKPAIEAEENHGFIPGSIEEKILPYVESSLNLVDKIIGKNSREKLMSDGVLEIKALAFIRGANIDNAILIMEEAQNMSPNQVKTLLTRIGENSKFIISGDMDQSDRYNRIEKTGLYDVIHRLKGKVDDIGFFSFSNDDIVRNPIISKILKFYQDKSELYSGKEKNNNPDKPIKDIQKKEDKNKKRNFFKKIFKW